MLSLCFLSTSQIKTLINYWETVPLLHRFFVCMLYRCLRELTHRRHTQHVSNFEGFSQRRAWWVHPPAPPPRFVLGRMVTALCRPGHPGSNLADGASFVLFTKPRTAATSAARAGYAPRARRGAPHRRRLLTRGGCAARPPPICSVPVIRRPPPACPTPSNVECEFCSF
jgi:hypothetical protein